MRQGSGRRRFGRGRTRGRVLAGVVASVAAVMGLAGITAATATATTRSCTIYWTGATSTDWNTATNWSLTNNGPGAGRVPKSSDFVCMSTAAAHTAVVLSSSTTSTVGGISWPASPVSPSLEVDGSLTIGVSGSIYSSNINVLAVRGGNLQLSAGDHATAGRLTLNGTIGQPGTLAVTGTATVGSGSDSGSSLGNGTHLILEGSTTVQGELTLKNGSEVENRGSLTLIDSATISAGDASANRLSNDAGAELEAVSDDGGGDTASVAVAAVNDGRVVDVSERLDFGLGKAPASETGTYDAGDGATLLITGGQTEAAGVDYGGQGVVVVQGAVTFTADADLSNTGEIVFSNGTIDTGVTVSAGHVELYNSTPAASALTGPGTLVATDGLDAEGFAAAPLSLDNVHVVLEGDSAVSEDNLELADGSVIENYGVLAVSGDGSAISSDGSSSNELVNEAGATLTGPEQSFGDLPSNSGFVDVRTINHGAITVTAASFFEFSSLSNLAGGTLQGGTYSATGGTLGLGGHVVTNDASILLAPGGVFDSAGPSPDPGTNSDLVTLRSNAGSFELGQPLALTGALSNSGTLALDASGTLSTPAFSQTASSTLTIHIDGAPSPGTHDGQLSVAGTARLNGTLHLETAPGYSPPIGTTYTLVKAGSISGRFSRITGQTLSDRGYVISYTATRVIATVVSLVLQVTGVSPNSGPAAGGTTVTITGSGFTPSATVKFGNVAATHVTYISSTKLTAVAPAQSAGTHNVFVTTSAGTTSAVSGDQYTYVAAVVTGVSPNSGPAAGGTTVTITGSGFTPSATVKFGNVAATHVTYVSSTKLTAVVPAQAAGTHNVYVITSDGSSATVTADQYTYR
jgi:hypothetical protein